MLKTQPFPWHWKKEKIKRSWNEEEQSENTSVIFCCFCLNETHCLSHTQCVWADRNQSSVTEILNEKITIAFFVLVFMLWCSLLPTYHLPKSSSLGAAALPALLQCHISAFTLLPFIEPFKTSQMKQTAYSESHQWPHLKLVWTL